MTSRCWDQLDAGTNLDKHNSNLKFRNYAVTQASLNEVHISNYNNKFLNFQIYRTLLFDPSKDPVMPSYSPLDLSFNVCY
jgi:hypothetical protein